MSRNKTLNRRQLLWGGAVLGGAVALGGGATALAGPMLDRDRPNLTHGVLSGDVNGDRGVIWTRADRSGKMWVELSTREDFKHSWKVRGSNFMAANDFTGKARVDGLPAGKTIHYRVWAEDEHRSHPLTGSFRTTPAAGHDVRFVWSGDIAGQGWGRNPDIGGYTIFADMAKSDPDFFLCSGDFYYGDNPLRETVKLPDGRVWKNVTSDAKSKVAETLKEFRGQYQYNLKDENLSAFLSTTPMINQWDDHEVLNNWYPGEIHDDPNYTIKSVDVLAARARKAFAEYTPNPLKPDGEGRIYRKISHGPLLDVFMLDMRTYKDPNTLNDSPDGGRVLGKIQLDWLKQELARSKATWKVIANDTPLANIIGDGPKNIEGIGQRDNGKPLGREIELAGLLSYIKKSKIKGLVWITTDVHYTAAHHYDPSRAAFTDFDPFWEFITGPINAGAFGPNKVDTTFGTKVEFAKAPDADHQNTTPLDGYQFYGEVAIDAASKDLTVRLMEIGGKELWTKTLGA
ncbi:MAG TPA: alkaline phosphatase D family protein [Stackebrandtia sp.]|jgi:alkaline phosphatase D|uniref:alkaline phosphatase D family protein n=1 Tax=Stackebrandtia sp. TaxID=2023065 RepID=UPI002D5A95A8|nr:alkaline phosphatase D family protein [Stackebrandtia sp.]HZE38218.1 alkaline phosphatase D family protein [Stackebrandtia sp.]